ncbi:NlpC/P60 family protein [Aliihoeflea sp. 40Bstr573]|uniref:NlpC/P60 family protein n=1 Tax=Aliihoeflea sp. 40Bstr573 TaxID=2696467 RepID=UPI00209407F5|nr:NlpC/P60 family protein [Aliihoeflea sp. 40Bstr573]MCO6388625.1 peptidase P60 [Aliihoeflea sp. 40Bstr573]
MRRGQVLEEARRWIGTPYRHQGSRLGVGCDCLGLLRGIWRSLYRCEPEAVPAYSRDWAEARRDEPLLEAARRHMTEVPVQVAMPGDVLAFRWRRQLPAKHLAILADGETIIHAYEGHAVAVSPLVPAWKSRIAAAFQFPA